MKNPGREGADLQVVGRGILHPLVKQKKNNEVS